jgi:hypothetical protein
VSVRRRLFQRSTSERIGDHRRSGADSVIPDRMRILTTLATLLLSTVLAHAEPANIEKLKLTIDFPGTIEVLDTDYTGKVKLPETEVRIKTSIREVGTVNIELEKKASTAEDAKKTIKIVASDASNMVVTKLPDKGWLLTWQYNKDQWYGVKMMKKVKGKWFELDARPESREAADTITAAFKTVRAM